MRILLVTREFPPDIGGISTYCGEIARAAGQLGYEVDVVAPWGGGGRGRSRMFDDGFDVYGFKGSDSPARDIVSLVWRVWDRLRVKRYDTVHACDKYGQIALWLVGKGGEARSCATIYGTDVTRWRYSGFHRHVDVWAYGYARRVAAISKYTLGQFEDMLRGRSKRPLARAIPLAISECWFREYRSRSLWERLPDRFVIGTVGRLVPRKGHKSVIAACSRLSDSLRRRLTYVVVGSGDAQLLEEIRCEAAKARVDFVHVDNATREDLVLLYRQMDVHVLFAQPFRHTVEGFGLVVLEAGSQRVPTIASDLGGIPEVIEHGYSGLLIKNEEELASRLSELADDRIRRAELGEGAYERARRRSWLDVARETYGFFALSGSD